jgi:hypothetical protein
MGICSKYPETGPLITEKMPATVNGKAEKLLRVAVRVAVDPTVTV